MNHARFHLPVTLTPKRQKQEGREFKTSLGYIMRHLCIEMHGCNPSPQETEVGGLSQVQG